MWQRAVTVGASGGETIIGAMNVIPYSSSWTITDTNHYGTYTGQKAFDGGNILTSTGWHPNGTNIKATADFGETLNIKMLGFGFAANNAGTSTVQLVSVEYATDSNYNWISIPDSSVALTSYGMYKLVGLGDINARALRVTVTGATNGNGVKIALFN